MNEEVASWYANIWIAGDHAQAVHACREFCQTGLCVTVTPTTYVYTNGLEDGVCVRLINYPRFPSTPEKITERAHSLAEHLCDRLFQGSYSVETPQQTVWISRRGEDK